MEKARDLGSQRPGHLEPAKAAHSGQKTCRVVAGPYFKRFLFINVSYTLRFRNQNLAAAKKLWNGALSGHSFFSMYAPGPTPPSNSLPIKVKYVSATYWLVHGNFSIANQRAYSRTRISSPTLKYGG